MIMKMQLIDLYKLEDEGELPENVAFKIVGGRAVYHHIGWMWRNSDKQIYLNKHGLFDYQEEKHRRYLADDTLVEIVSQSA
jgi:hypothetical protein